IIYREMLMPLRVQLVETNALLQRQEKLASLGILAAGVAHEIRNPLTAIKARIFTQIRNLQVGSPEYQNARVIDSEINRLEKIVKDFLQFARPSDPDLTSIKPGELFSSIHQLMEPQLAKEKIELKMVLDTESVFRGDWEQLKQVLINLIQNAAESIENTGTITLRAYEKRIGPPPARGYLVLEVRDSGKGIRPEVEKRLFDPFYTTKETGTGLGLSIAARIIEKHHGMIQVEPTAGATAFKLLLPSEI
ncbi:MAG: histidine kinase, partial [Verrucomicrobiales bacterium]|nr:histidine kinase [Verrucomicrobiales bacterium]